jgi:hypothetical protein
MPTLQITARRKSLLEKLIVSQLVEDLPALYRM